MLKSPGLNWFPNRLSASTNRNKFQEPHTLAKVLNAESASRGFPSVLERSRTYLKKKFCRLRIRASFVDVRYVTLESGICKGTRAMRQETPGWDELLSDTDTPLWKCKRVIEAACRRVCRHDRQLQEDLFQDGWLHFVRKWSRMEKSRRPPGDKIFAWLKVVARREAGKCFDKFKRTKDACELREGHDLEQTVPCVSEPTTDVDRRDEMATQLAWVEKQLGRFAPKQQEAFKAVYEWPGEPDVAQVAQQWRRCEERVRQVGRSVRRALRERVLQGAVA